MKNLVLGLAVSAMLLCMAACTKDKNDDTRTCRVSMVMTDIDNIVGRYEYNADGSIKLYAQYKRLTTGDSLMNFNTYAYSGSQVIDKFYGHDSVLSYTTYHTLGANGYVATSVITTDLKNDTTYFSYNNEGHSTGYVRNIWSKSGGVNTTLLRLAFSYVLVDGNRTEITFTMGLVGSPTSPVSTFYEYYPEDISAKGYNSNPIPFMGKGDRCLPKKLTRDGGDSVTYTYLFDGGGKPVKQIGYYSITGSTNNMYMEYQCR